MPAKLFEEDLRTSLESIEAQAKILLEQLKASPPGECTSSALPLDPLDGCPRIVKLARRKLADASTRLLQLATRPEDYLEHLQNGYQNLTCIRWIIDLDVLEHVPKGGLITYRDLSIAAGVPHAQLKGIVRMAICNGFLEEPQPDHIQHSRISALFARDESFLSWARWMVNYSVPTAFKFAEATRTWGETTAKDQTAFNLGLNVKVPFFDHLRAEPCMTDAFAGYMRNVTSNETWSLEHAVQGFDWAALPPGAKIVDIGGSSGHGSIAIAKKFPNLRFVVQDLPETIAKARNDLSLDETVHASIKARVEYMEHDFFQAQPIKDADIYFLRMICHDWPDSEATKILSHIRAAMKPGARIIVMETILPDPGSMSSLLQEQQLRIRDLTMMQVFNAKERDMGDWRALTAASGLQIAHSHQAQDSVMGLLTIQPAVRESLPRMDSVDSQQQAGVTKSMPSSEQSAVLIIGGGISGLCLAQALHKQNIDFRVFERDQALESRPQGYRLKLEADAVKALKAFLPDAVFKAVETSGAITEVGETDYNPFTGDIVHSRAGGGLSGKQGLYANLTVDRKTFRSQLMTGIEDKVNFGKELVDWTPSYSKDSVTARFKDGTIVTGSFLAGADGLHSVVRKTCHPAHRLVDTGALCVYGKTVDTKAIRARFPEKGLRWMTIASDSAPMLQSCLVGHSPVTLLLEPIRWDTASRAEHPDLPADYLYWALIGRKERFGISDTTDVKAGLSPESAAEHARQLSLSVTEEWHPSIRALFEMQDPEQTSAVRVASTVPEITSWTSQPYVTVLGDAIHPMSPCGGVGANTAILDADALANVLSQRTNSSLAAISEYEEGVRKRALWSIIRSEIGSKAMFGQKDLVDCPAFKA